MSDKTYRGRTCGECRKMTTHALTKEKRGNQWYYVQKCTNCGNEKKRKCDNPHKRGES